jgi:endoglucanase
VTVPNTFGWQKWATIRRHGAYLGAGTYLLRLVMDGNGATGWVGNFNSISVTPGTTALGSAAATHVRDGSYRYANYGSSPLLEVKKSTTSYNREAYLKFDLGGVSSVSNARLRLFGGLTDSVAASIGLAVHSAGNTSWAESTLSWSNKPAADAAAALASTTIAGTTAKWYEIDLTAFVKSKVASGAGGVVTLVLRSTTATSTLCEFNSDEAASNQPQLVVTT